MSVNQSSGANEGREVTFLPPSELGIKTQITPMVV